MKKYCITIVYCLLACNIFAQLCTGSLGDPVVHITFGNGSTQGGALKAGITNMSYAATCPNDGSYTITSSSSGCFNNTWHSFFGDHTGDPGGRVMLINASFDPSTFYADTVKGLCGNTVYEFAAWAANVLRSSACGNAGIMPNLTFRIESTTGTLLKEIHSGDIPSTGNVVWKQYGTFFTTPAGTGEVVLRIRNNSNGGCGNDLMLDDITFRPCGPKITAYPEQTTDPLITVCGDQQTDTKFIANYSTGFTDPELQWQVSNDSGKTWVDINGEKGITYTRKPMAAGYYQYRVAISERVNAGSVNCRVVSNVTTIHVPTPPISAAKTIIGCEGISAALETAKGTGYTYSWTGPGGFTSSASGVSFPSAQIVDSGLYVATISVFSCTAKDSFYLRVFPNAKAIAGGGGSICEGTGTSLHASGGTGYAWTPVTGLSSALAASPVASPVDTTRYKVIVTNQYGCTDSGFVTVNVWKKPVADAGPDQQIFSGDPAVLNGKISGTAVSYSWSPVLGMLNSNSLAPVVYPEDNTTYRLTVVSPFGCTPANDDVLIKVYKAIRPPNVFSPNADGINDTWIIPGLETYPESIVSVYGRTGQLLFRTKSVNKIWDGKYNNKPLPIGTYYYLIDLAVGRPAVSGWVLIVR